jgi:hypothetical protein
VAGFSLLRNPSIVERQLIGITSLRPSYELLPSGALPEGKHPLQVIISAKTIEDAKIKAIQGKIKVSGVVEELLAGWLNGTHKLKKIDDQ